MKVTFTPDELVKVAKWSDQITTAMRSNYARGMGRRDCEELDAILEAALARAGLIHHRTNSGCGGCVYNLLLDAGHIIENSLVAGAKAETEKTPAKPRKAAQTGGKTARQ